MQFNRIPITKRIKNAKNTPLRLEIATSWASHWQEDQNAAMNALHKAIEDGDIEAAKHHFDELDIKNGHRLRHLPKVFGLLAENLGA